MVFDAIVSLVTYFVTKYFSPDAAKDVLLVIGTMQPVIIAVIASITVQNVQAMKSQAPTPRK